MEFNSFLISASESLPHNSIFAFSLSLISTDDFFVNVIAVIFSGLTSSNSILRIFAIINQVFPVPASAVTFTLTPVCK